MIFSCPGSDKFKHPRPENIKCVSCGEDLEIWTDEAQVKCAKCGKIVRREEAQSCLDWCKYAKECIGEEAYRIYLEKKSKDEK